MIFKNIKHRFLFSIVLLAVSICCGCLGYFVWHKWWALFFCIPVIYQMYYLYDAISKAQDDLEEFAQSVHYRDFTKNFNIKKSPAEVKELRNSFNEINSTFKLISLEKET